MNCYVLLDIWRQLTHRSLETLVGVKEEELPPHEQHAAGHDGHVSPLARRVTHLRREAARVTMMSERWTLECNCWMSIDTNLSISTVVECPWTAIFQYAACLRMNFYVWSWSNSCYDCWAADLNHYRNKVIYNPTCDGCQLHSPVIHFCCCWRAR